MWFECRPKILKKYAPIFLFNIFCDVLKTVTPVAEHLLFVAFSAEFL